jgi:hypothetical protein
VYGTVCFCIHAVTLITSPPSDCSQHLTPRAPQRALGSSFSRLLSTALDVGRLPAYGPRALPLATRDGRGHPSTHTHAPCGRQRPGDATFRRKGIDIERSPNPHAGEVWSMRMPALHARTTCPRRGPPWAPGVSVVCSCVRCMWRHAMPLEHGTSHEHVRGGRGAWDQHHEHMISQVRGYHDVLLP